MQVSCQLRHPGLQPLRVPGQTAMQTFFMETGCMVTPDCTELPDYMVIWVCLDHWGCMGTATVRIVTA